MTSDWVLAPPWRCSQWFNVGVEEAPTLARLRGKVVVLHAFQMLCPACVAHGVPLAEQIHRTADAKDLAVVGLHTVFEHHAAMTPVALEAYLHEYRVTHPVGVDVHAPGQAIPATMATYGMRGTPTLLVIDRAGRIRQHLFGPVDALALGMLLGGLMAESGDAST